MVRLKLSRAEVKAFRFLAVCLFASLCFAQSGSTIKSKHLATGITTATDSTAADTVTSSYWGAGPITISGGSVTNLCWTQNGATICNAGVWSGGGSDLSEHRKDDGHGPTVAQVRASAAVLKSDELPSASYIKLAKSVGLNPSVSVDEAAIMDAIHERNLKVYDFAKVDDYLYRQALKQGSQTRWVWKPMRAADMQKVEGSASRITANVGYVYPEQYAKRLPERILEEVSCLLDELPSNAAFLVSDFAVVKPDPFLAVTTPALLAEGKIWIIDQWDEPNFHHGSIAKASKQ